MKLAKDIKQLKYKATYETPTGYWEGRSTGILTPNGCFEIYPAYSRRNKGASNEKYTYRKHKPELVPNSRVFVLFE